MSFPCPHLKIEKVKGCFARNLHNALNEYVCSSSELLWAAKDNNRGYLLCWRSFSIR